MRVGFFESISRVTQFSSGNRSWASRPRSMGDARSSLFWRAPTLAGAVNAADLASMARAGCVLVDEIDAACRSVSSVYGYPHLVRLPETDTRAPHFDR